MMGGFGGATSHDSTCWMGKDGLARGEPKEVEMDVTNECDGEPIVPLSIRIICEGSVEESRRRGKGDYRGEVDRRRRES